MRSASSALSVPSTILLFPPASPHHPQTLGLFTIYFQTGSCRTFICALQGMETRQRGGASGGAGTWSIWARTELTWSASAKLVSAVLTRRSAPRAPGTRVCVSVCAR